MDYRVAGKKLFSVLDTYTKRVDSGFGIDIGDNLIVFNYYLATQSRNMESAKAGFWDLVDCLNDRLVSSLYEELAKEELEEIFQILEELSKHQGLAPSPSLIQSLEDSKYQSIKSIAERIQIIQSGVSLQT